MTSRRDDRPTPRRTPFFQHGPTLAALANDYAKRLDEEAATCGLPNRTAKCMALAQRMRALMLEFQRWTRRTPVEAMRDANARWMDVRSEVDMLRLPPGELTQ